MSFLPRPAAPLHPSRTAARCLRRNSAVCRCKQEQEAGVSISSFTCLDDEVNATTVASKQLPSQQASSSSILCAMTDTCEH